MTTLGHGTYSFLASPAKVPTAEFFGIAFVIVAAAMYYARFVNRLSD